MAIIRILKKGKIAVHYFRLEARLPFKKPLLHPSKLNLMIRYFSIGFLLLLATSCATLPKSYQTKDEVITVGAGPEDMVVDTLTEQPRILLSCNSRRKGEADYGEIEAYYPETKTRKVLKRLNEPAGLHFNPHGIDLVLVNAKWPSPTSNLVLLVVNHEREQHINSILRYHVLKDELVFINKIVDTLISSPNAVAGFSDGTLLVSNDAKKHGSNTEVFFMLKRAQIVYWNGKDCSVAAEKFCFTNGITIKDNKKVYLASTRQNKVWQFDFDNGKMINKEVIAKVNGADNLRLDGNDLLVACHLRFMMFLKHMKDAHKFSPTTVYRINPTTKKKTVEYFDDGKQISAGSTALMFHNNLYVSGIFDAKIVRKGIH